jgi:hypothetical protein
LRPAAGSMNVAVDEQFASFTESRFELQSVFAAHVRKQ